MNGDREIIETSYIEDELKESYIDYAMSVIIGRALPDVRDGLKPVHRRILHAMNEVGLTSDHGFKKSATVVGEVLGKYHPHGDSAVYDTMVRMVQDFSLRYPLIDGQGNFGSVDGDAAAAYRYTEVRMKKISSELLADIDKETVEFIPTFDGSHEEPTVLPGKIPNLLLNGSAGIAVGMATNIPPHNLGELVDAITLVIDKPEATVNDILKVMPGPDFPTGGIIFGRQGIRDYYETGRGKIRIGAVAGVEEASRAGASGREAIIITELPYQVNKSQLIMKIAELVREKKIEGISDIRDESDRDGMRMVIELKRDAESQVVLNKLQKHTQLLDTFGVIMLAIVENRPKIMGIPVVIGHFIEHRRVVIRRRSEFLLKKAEADAHIKEGLLKAIAHIDEIIALIRKSKDREDAHKRLMDRFKFSDLQTKAILDLRLHRLTSLERIEEERLLAELLKEIERLKFILGHAQEILEIIKSELKELRDKFADKRRTRIVDEDVGDFAPEDLIKQEDVVIMISHAGYIKRLPLSGYRAQRRGGKGVAGMETKEEDFVEHILIASTHNYLLFFTEKGRCHWLKVYDIPQLGRAAKGKAIINLLQMESGDKIAAFVPVDKFDAERFILMATRAGIVKKTALSSYGNPRVGGIIAINLDKGDGVIQAVLTDGSQDVVLATQGGIAIRFPEQKCRPTGRATGGVKGIELEKGDAVIGMVLVRSGSSIFALCKNGYGKRTDFDEYRRTNRGGKGVINIKATDRNGEVVAIREVIDTDELILATTGGVVIRMKASDIKSIGRNTQGVRIIKLDGGDSVTDVTVLSQKAQEEAQEE